MSKKSLKTAAQLEAEIAAALEAERRNNCMYCGKPTRKGSALIDGYTAHKACIKEFES